MKALVLDMDGTMVDSERALIRLWGAIARELGHEIDEAVMISTVGTTHEDTNLTMRAAYPAAPHDEINRETGRRFAHALANGQVAVRPGLCALLNAARDKGIPVGVCTSTGRASAEETLRAAGVFHRIAAMVCGGEAARGKPDPAPYLLAARRLGVSPEDCVAVEDSPSGARSALAAGMTVAVVPDLLPVPPDVAARVRVLSDLSEAAALL